MSPLDGSLQPDRNKYRDDSKRSLDEKVMTILEMHVLTSDYRIASNLTKMASDGKSYGCKVLRLIETDDFRSYAKVTGKIVRCSSVWPDHPGRGPDHPGNWSIKTPEGWR